MGGSTAGGAGTGRGGPIAGSMVVDHGVAGTATGATGSHSENNDLNREEQSQPEKHQASVAAENLRAGTEVQSQSAETVGEAASTVFAA